MSINLKIFRKCFAYIWLLSFLLTSCEKPHVKKYEIPKSEQAVNKLLYRIAHDFEKKYKINTMATNVAMPRGVVKLLGLDFQIQGPLSREEIRKILIELAQNFLIYINTDEAIKPYLENYPFEIKNLGITLFFIDSKRIEIEDPNIGIAEISRGNLTYQTLITHNNMPFFKSEFEESYEEAVVALHEH